MIFINGMAVDVWCGTNMTTHRTHRITVTNDIIKFDIVYDCNRHIFSIPTNDIISGEFRIVLSHMFFYDLVVHQDFGNNFHAQFYATEVGINHNGIICRYNGDIVDVRGWDCLNEIYFKFTFTQENEGDLGGN